MCEPNQPNKNPAEALIQELRMKWFQTKFKSNCQRKLYCFELHNSAKIMQRTASNLGNLDEHIQFVHLIGESPDI